MQARDATIGEVVPVGSERPAEVVAEDGSAAPPVVDEDGRSRSRSVAVGALG